MAKISDPLYISLWSITMHQAVTFLSNYNNQICNVHNERQIRKHCSSALTPNFPAAFARRARAWWGEKHPGRKWRF